MTRKPESAQPRKGMPSPRLGEDEFKRRFLDQFQDTAFSSLQAELNKMADAAWDGYSHSRKSPRTRRAGEGYADPDYQLAHAWIDAADAVHAALRAHRDDAEHRILLINASPRSEHTCPGEMSKSYRLAQMAQSVFLDEHARVDLLDLSRLSSEYGRQIHPCKACFSTSPALCHWPCSCYPNHSLGQVHDWMNEIYPRWVAAHGVMIITPVNWYQTTSPLKLMMDRLVCADGGNPDPTTTHGKDAAKAKAIELAGWYYPKHLAGRLFAIVVHGDAEGIVEVKRALSDWLTSMDLESAGATAELSRYIGYWKPYATSHEDLDLDIDLQEEVRLTALTLIKALKARRSTPTVSPATAKIRMPRQK